MPTFKRQTLGTRRFAAKARKKRMRAPRRSSFRKLSPATRRRLSIARSKFMKKFGKKIAALRSSLDLPSTLVGSVKHNPDYIKMIVEGAREVCEDMQSAREFAQHYLAKDPAFSNTDTGMAALLFEVKLAEFTGGMYGVFLETILEAANQATFLAIFDGRLRKEELERFGNEIEEFCTFDIAVKAGDLDRENGTVSDITMLECKAMPGAKSYKLPPVTGSSTTVGDTYGGSKAGSRFLPRTTSAYESVAKDGGLSDKIFMRLFHDAVHEDTDAEIRTAVDPNGVTWIHNEGVWNPDIDTVQEVSRHKDEYVLVDRKGKAVAGAAAASMDPDEIPAMNKRLAKQGQHFIPAAQYRNKSESTRHREEYVAVDRSGKPLPNTSPQQMYPEDIAAENVKLRKIGHKGVRWISTLLLKPQYSRVHEDAKADVKALRKAHKDPKFISYMKQVDKLSGKSFLPGDIAPLFLSGVSASAAVKKLGESMDEAQGSIELVKKASGNQPAVYKVLNSGGGVEGFLEKLKDTSTETHPWKAFKRTYGGAPGRGKGLGAFYKKDGGKRAAIKAVMKESLDEAKTKFKKGDKVKFNALKVLQAHARSVPAHMGYTTAEFAYRKNLNKHAGETGTVTRVFPGGSLNLTFKDGSVFDIQTKLQVGLTPVSESLDEGSHHKEDYILVNAAGGIVPGYSPVAMPPEEVAEENKILQGGLRFIPARYDLHRGTAWESVNEDEKARARKMKKKGYKVVLVLPKKEGEPLYAKTAAQASKMAREEYPNAKIMPIDNFIKESFDEARYKEGDRVLVGRKKQKGVIKGTPDRKYRKKFGGAPAYRIVFDNGTSQYISAAMLVKEGESPDFSGEPLNEAQGYKVTIPGYKGYFIVTGVGPTTKWGDKRLVAKAQHHHPVGTSKVDDALTQTLLGSIVAKKFGKQPNSFKGRWFTSLGSSFQANAKKAISGAKVAKETASVHEGAKAKAAEAAILRRVKGGKFQLSDIPYREVRVHFKELQSAAKRLAKKGKIKYDGISKVSESLDEAKRNVLASLKILAKDYGGDPAVKGKRFAAWFESSKKREQFARDVRMEYPDIKIKIAGKIVHVMLESLDEVFSTADASEISQADALKAIKKSGLSVRVIKKTINTTGGMRKSTSVALKSAKLSDAQYDKFLDLRTNTGGVMLKTRSAKFVDVDGRDQYASFRVVHGTDVPESINEAKVNPYQAFQKKGVSKGMTWFVRDTEMKDEYGPYMSKVAAKKQASSWNKQLKSTRGGMKHYTDIVTGVKPFSTREDLDEAKTNPPGVGPDPNKWSQADQKKVINYYAKWPLKKLRKHQDLVISQQTRTGGDVKALKSLQTTERLLAAAVYKREFGESDDDLYYADDDTLLSKFNAWTVKREGTDDGKTLVGLGQAQQVYAIPQTLQEVQELLENIGEHYSDLPDEFDAVVEAFLVEYCEDHGELQNNYDTRSNSLLEGMSEGGSYAYTLERDRRIKMAGKMRLLALGEADLGEARKKWTPKKLIAWAKRAKSRRLGLPRGGAFGAMAVEVHGSDKSGWSANYDTGPTGPFKPVTKGDVDTATMVAKLNQLGAMLPIRESTTENYDTRSYLFEGDLDGEHLTRWKAAMARLKEITGLPDVRETATGMGEGEDEGPTHLKSLASKAGVTMQRAIRLWGRAQLAVMDQYPKIKKKSARYYQAATGIMKKMMKLPTKPLATNEAEDEAELFIIENLITGALYNEKGMRAAAKQSPKLNGSSESIKKVWGKMLKRGDLAPAVGDLYMYEPIFWSGAQGTVRRVNASADEATRSTSIHQLPGLNAKTGRNPMKMRTTGRARGGQKYRMGQYENPFEDYEGDPGAGDTMLTRARKRVARLNLKIGKNKPDDAVADAARDFAKWPYESLYENYEDIKELIAAEVKKAKNVLGLKWKNNLPLVRVDEAVKRWGKPQIIASDRVIWTEGIAPYSEIQVIDEMIPHMHPKPHVDCFYSRLNYEVPSSHTWAIRSVSESIMYDELKKVITARCDNMAANVVSLHLAKRIAENKIDSGTAYKMYGGMIAKAMEDPKFFDAMERTLREGGMNEAVCESIDAQVSLTESEMLWEWADAPEAKALLDEVLMAVFMAEGRIDYALYIGSFQGHKQASINGAVAELQERGLLVRQARETLGDRGHDLVLTQNGYRAVRPLHEDAEQFDAAMRVQASLRTGKPLSPKDEEFYRRVLGEAGMDIRIIADLKDAAEGLVKTAKGDAKKYYQAILAGKRTEAAKLLKTKAGSAARVAMYKKADVSLNEAKIIFRAKFKKGQTVSMPVLNATGVIVSVDKLFAGMGPKGTKMVPQYQVKITKEDSKYVSVGQLLHMKEKDLKLGESLVPPQYSVRWGAKKKRGKATRKTATNEAALKTVSDFYPKGLPPSSGMVGRKDLAVITDQDKKKYLTPNELWTTDVNKALAFRMLGAAKRYAGKVERRGNLGADMLSSVLFKKAGGRYENLDESVHVAKEIQKQIGRQAFSMMGTKQLVGDKKSLMWKIGKNAKGVTKIRVTLTPADEYNVEFIRLRKKKGVPEVKVLKHIKGIQADQLHKTIEANTGLRLSLTRTFEAANA